MLIQPHYKKKAAECVSVFCLPPMTRLRLLSGKKLAAKSAAKSAAAANAQKSLDQKLPAKCPAVATFLAGDNSASAPPNARALLQQLEQCIQGGQAAIGQLEQLRARPNALALIREAFEADGELGAARDFVDKFVAQVKAQFELVKQIEKVMPSLLEELCSGSAPAQEENAPSERLLARNFAKLLELALRFDCLKAETPALQNGFSIYRRMSVVSSFGAEQLYAHLGDQISLFLSRPTPLLCSLVNGTERFIGRQLCRQLAVAHVVEALLVIYNVLKHTLERRRQLNLNSGDGQAQNSVGDFVLRAMVALLLLYDHIEREPAGVFCPSNSPLDVTDFVALVQRNCSIEKAQQHLAGLRFMSRHFNDRETPSHVRKLFN